MVLRKEAKCFRDCILTYLSEPYLKHEIKLVGEAGLMSAGGVSECWIMSASDIAAQYFLGQWPKNCNINKNSSEAGGWGQKITEFQRFKYGQKTIN